MIELIIQTSAGVVKITGEHETEVIKRAAFWFDIPEACPVCKALGMTLGYRTPQTFEYYSAICKGPERHEVNFGEKKGTHDLYFDVKKDWKKYQFQTGDGSDAGPRDPNAGPGVTRSNDAAGGVTRPAEPAANMEFRSRTISQITQLETRYAAASFVSGVKLETINDKTDAQLSNILILLKSKCEKAGLPTATE